MTSRPQRRATSEGGRQRTDLPGLEGVLLDVPEVGEVVEAAMTHDVLLHGRAGSGRTTVLLAAARALRDRGVSVRWVTATGWGGIQDQDQDQDLGAGDARGHGVIVVDDVDTVDDLRSTAIHQAVQRRGWRLVASATTVTAVPRRLQSIDDRRPVVVEVRPMTVAQADVLMRHADAPDLSLRRRREVLRLADARVGVLCDVLADLAERPPPHPSVDDGAGPLPIGPRCRARASAALQGLDDTHVRFLERTALAASIPISLLHDADLDLADLMARRGLVQADSHGRMLVADPLVRVHLLDQMSPISRQMHGRWLGQLLERDAHDELPAWIVVPWRLLAGLPLTDQELVDAAIASPDPEIAERLATAAVGGLGGRAAEIALARIYLVLGRTDAAEDLLGTDAIRVPVEPDGAVGVPPLLAARTFALAREGRPARARALVERAESDDTQQLARLVELVIGGDVAAGIEHGREMLAGTYSRRAALIMAWGYLLLGQPGAALELLSLDEPYDSDLMEASAVVALSGHALLLTDIDALEARMLEWEPEALGGRNVRLWLLAEVEAARGHHREALAMLRAAEAEAADLDPFGTLPVVRWVALRLAQESVTREDVLHGRRPTPEVLPWGAPAAVPAAMTRLWESAGKPSAEVLALADELLATTGESLMPAVLVLHTLLRIGVRADQVLQRVPAAAWSVQSPVLRVMVTHIDAAAARDQEALLDVARSFQAIGQTLMAAEARAQAGVASLAHAHMPRTPLRCLPGPVLTARETELVQLVRDGLTNAEVAARLTLSVRTVETHLSSAYRKLGIARRSQLADL